MRRALVQPLYSLKITEIIGKAEVRKGFLVWIGLSSIFGVSYQLFIYLWYCTLQITIKFRAGRDTRICQRLNPTNELYLSAD
jgi:hypothetical protein